MAGIKNLDKAAKRIKKAVKKQENIILFSDADFDGVSSLIILEEAITSLGGKVAARYFPDREKHGYGLSQTFLDEMRPVVPGLLIISDSGIASFLEIELAKKMGLSVIVVDHHEVLEGKLPKADIIIDPKQESDDYPFKLLAACGLCLKLAELLVDNQSMMQSFKELAALGSIADMVPEVEDNKPIIDEGVASLAHTLRPGLKVLSGIFGGNVLSLRQMVSKIISVLQLTDFEGYLTESYLLLTAKTEHSAQELAEVLVEKSERRHQVIRDLVEEVQNRDKQEGGVIVFEGGADIPHLLTGNIASKISQRLEKPTFIYSTKADISRGSLRMPHKKDGLSGLVHCQQFLEVYGGHPQAAGFTIKNGNLNKLRFCLTQYFKNA